MHALSPIPSSSPEMNGPRTVSLWSRAFPVLPSLILMLLLQGHATCSSASVRWGGQAGYPASAQLRHGISCAGCVVVVSIVEQFAQLHNSSIEAAMERLCSYMPEELDMKDICKIVVKWFGADFVKLLNKKMNPDVVCSAVSLCKQEPGKPACRVYRTSQEEIETSIKKARRILSLRNRLLKFKEKIETLIKKARRILKPHKDLLKYKGDSDVFTQICSLPILRKICQKIEYSISNKVPIQDFDGDKFSSFPTFRGYLWRGKDCTEKDGAVYPGRRPVDWDALEDTNCNGIMGIDPEDGVPYEKKFCEGTDSKGIILLGDSAGAHFHIPPEWIAVQQMSLKAFENLPLAITNELDWPQSSAYTGFQDSTIGGWTDSIYLRLRNRNRCNHRDYQNISKNGGSSSNLLEFIKSLARKQPFDEPAVVIYQMIGNDVCNWYRDTLAGMTTPQQMHANVMEALKYLDSQLPNGSNVILTGLADGRFLWDHLHNRYYPLGQLNKDITYEQIYSFLSCLEINPCQGWMTSNETLRNLTSARALQLSHVLEEIAVSKRFSNFDIHYLDYPFAKIADVWKKREGEGWQLIEPVDGFHPNQIASALQAEIVWQEVLQRWPHIFGKENPHNAAIEKAFGNQGGH